MLREGQSKAMENMTQVNPMTSMPGFDAMRTQQEAFFKAMTGGMMGAGSSEKGSEGSGDDLSDIKDQLASLQEKLSKMGK
jgi:hypothetical protein